MSFRNAVNAAPAPVNQAYCQGKQALKHAHRGQVNCRNDARITGSLDLDGALVAIPHHAQANRWDYGLGYQLPNGKECAIWVEVHHATTSEVRVILKKLDWLKQYLANEATALQRITTHREDVKPYVWIASGKVRIPQHTPQAKRLLAAGLSMPRGRLDLP